MNRDEMNAMSKWLWGRADHIEISEPYATTTIDALRTAAEEVDAAEADDE